MPSRRRLTLFAPDLQPVTPQPLEEFVAHYGCVAACEVAAVYDTCLPKAEQALNALGDGGRVRAIECDNGAFWQPLTTRHVTRNNKNIGV